MSIFESDLSNTEPFNLPLIHGWGAATGSRPVLPSVHRRMIGPFVLLEQIGPRILEAGEGFDIQPHPHLGLASVTYLIDGEIRHRDSLGSVQTIRPGEVNWMTAGSGIVHSERTPAEIRQTGGALLGIQAWIALPVAFEDVSPSFMHHGASAVPRSYDDGVELNVIAGRSDGLVSPVQTYSDMIFAEIVLTSGARYQVRPDHAERAVYVIAGELEIVGQPAAHREGELVVLPRGAEVILRAPAFHSTRLVLIGGEPFAEPRYMFWNFVSSSTERIEQAKSDWRERLFPAIVGEDDQMPLPPT